MTAWEFLEEPTGQWRWRTSDPAASRPESCKTFKSGADCVANALRHGYLAGRWGAPVRAAVEQAPAARR